MCVIYRAPAEAVHGGAGGVPAGDFVQRFLLRGRLCGGAVAGLHDGAQEGKAGSSSTRYGCSTMHTDPQTQNLPARIPHGAFSTVTCGAEVM